MLLTNPKAALSPATHLSKLKQPACRKVGECVILIAKLTCQSKVYFFVPEAFPVRALFASPSLLQKILERPKACSSTYTIALADTTASSVATLLGCQDLQCPSPSQRGQDLVVGTIQVDDLARLPLNPGISASAYFREFRDAGPLHCLKSSTRTRTNDDLLSPYGQESNSP